MTELLPMREQIALPCPFCGGPARTPVHFNGTLETGCGGNFECPGTDVLVPIAAWNLRAAPASPEGDGWLPIESAPKTWRPLGDGGGGTWDTPWMLCGKFHRWGFCSWVGMLDADMWLGRDDDAGCFDTEAPDVWRPLPDPPRAMIAAAPGVVGGGDRSGSAVADIARPGPIARPETSSLPVGKKP